MFTNLSSSQRGPQILSTIRLKSVQFADSSSLTDIFFLKNVFETKHVGDNLLTRGRSRASGDCYTQDNIFLLIREHRKQNYLPKISIWQRQYEHWLMQTRNLLFHSQSLLSYILLKSEGRLFCFLRTENWMSIVWVFALALALAIVWKLLW